MELIYPTLKAVADLGGSASGREIIPKVLADFGATDDQVAISYDNRPKSVLIARLEWARSYAKQGRALGSPAPWCIQGRRSMANLSARVRARGAWSRIRRRPTDRQ